MKDIPIHQPPRTIIIKRYQNRKLYDTKNSSYVTLEDIGNMIRRGDDVRVVDNRSKEDLTSVTLMQIIFEEEKQSKSLMPLGILKKIIMEGGETIRDFFSKTTGSVQTTFSAAKEGVEQAYERIVDELHPGDDGLIKEVFQKSQDITKNLGEKIKDTVGSLAHTASLQNEIRKLRQRILFLEKKLKVYER